MKENYPKAFTEVLEILKYMPIDDVKKIPKELIDTFEYNKDNNYKFIISEDQDFSTLKILDETEAIMVNIFEDYWATPEQKAKIRAKEQYDMQIIEEEKKKKYNYDDMFKNKYKSENDNITESSSLPNVIPKDNFIKKILTFIKNIFHKDI